MSNNFTFVTAGGRIRCLQCQAKSKRTKQQCRAPASKGKTKCRFHGGASTGPNTPEGRQRCAEAKTIHGNETREARTDRAEAMRRHRPCRIYATPQYGCHRSFWINGLSDYGLIVLKNPKTSKEPPT